MSKTKIQTGGLTITVEPLSFYRDLMMNNAIVTDAAYHVAKAKGYDVSLSASGYNVDAVPLPLWNLAVMFARWMVYSDVSGDSPLANADVFHPDERIAEAFDAWETFIQEHDDKAREWKAAVDALRDGQKKDA